MLVLISCAKTMSNATSKVVPFTSEPRFMKEASDIAASMSQFPVEDLERMLQVNAKIAVENYRRYQIFLSKDATFLPAVFAYTGIVFKRLNPSGFSVEDFNYAQDHLRLTSFCYGLLCPLDLIHTYRLEGNVILPEMGGRTLFAYWQSLLTEIFIQDIKHVGGVLCYLASEEMKSLFDWKRVEREVEIIEPEFHTWSNGKLKTIVVYTKMCRGEMSQYILKNKIERPEDLKAFTWEGFEFNDSLSDDKKYVFTNGIG